MESTRELFQRHSLRCTRQRMAVYEALRGCTTHPTAEELYRIVHHEAGSLSLATVYRNLNLLADQGEILRLEVNKEFHFDGDTCFHQHCVCRECGMITDIFQKEISHYAMNKIKAKGFKPDCVCIIYKGLCKECNRR